MFIFTYSKDKNSCIFTTMYLKFFLTMLLCEAYATNVLAFQNCPLLNCLKNLKKTKHRGSFDELYLANVMMTCPSLKQGMSTNSNSPIFYIPEYGKVITGEELDVEKLLVEAWMKDRSNIRIFQFERNNFTLTTNLNLEDSKACTGHFYETYNDICGNLTVTKNFLSDDNLEILCRIRVAWIKSSPFVIDTKRKNNPGMMISILRTYEEKTKAKVILQKDNRVYQDELLNHGTFSKLQDHLFKGEHDVGIGPLFINFTENFTFSYGPVFFKDYYYITIKKVRIPSYQKLIVALNASVWRSFLVIFLLVVSSYVASSAMVEPSRIGFVTAIFDVMRVTLNYSIPNLPRSISLRLLFVFYSIFSITIDTAYLGTLSSVLTDVPYEEASQPIDILKWGFHVNFMADRLIKLQMAMERQFPNVKVLVTNETDEDILKEVS